MDRRQDACCMTCTVVLQPRPKYRSGIDARQVRVANSPVIGLKPRGQRRRYRHPLHRLLALAKFQVQIHRKAIECHPKVVVNKNPCTATGDSRPAVPFARNCSAECWHRYVYVNVPPPRPGAWRKCLTRHLRLLSARRTEQQHGQLFCWLDLHQQDHDNISSNALACPALTCAMSVS